MSQRFKSILAVCFALQIVLPFTASVQACNLTDLLGAYRQSAPVSPASSTTPISEAESEASFFVSPLAVSRLRASASLAVVCQVIDSAPFLAVFHPSPAQVQQTVLRV